MFSEKISSVKELKQVAQKLISEFPDERVFAFYGKMGAGKTTFIQSICEVIGTDDNVTSPTFAIINEYKTRDLKSIYHFDFYRIREIEEAYDLGYEDYIYSGNYCFIEWPEKIETLLPDDIVEVHIEADEKDNRLIKASIS